MENQFFICQLKEKGHKLKGLKNEIILKPSVTNEAIHYLLSIKRSIWIISNNIFALSAHSYHASVKKWNVDTVTLLSEKQRARTEMGL